MISEEQVLKDAIAYLNGEVSGVTFVPHSQKNEHMTFPCGVVRVSSRPSTMSIHGEVLALVTVSVAVYADNLYSTASQSGVMSIMDSINDAMDSKGYQRSNQTEPFYSTYRKWSKDSDFQKRTNVF